jgi:hypothetical protein
MKKIVIFALFISMLLSSGFSLTLNSPWQKPADRLSQEETTETTESVETTEATEPTVETTATQEPTNTPTSVPTNTLVTYPTITITPTQYYSRPLLNLRSYTYDDTDTYAGGEFSLKAVFQNLGQEKAYNVVITFTSSDLTPVENGGVAIIGGMDVGDKSAKTMYFAVADDIDYSPAKINVEVEYHNERGSSYTQSFVISVSIAGFGPYHSATPIGRPQMVVADYESDVDPLEPGALFKLSMSLQNRGLVTAKSVSMTIGSTSSSSSTSTTTESFLPVGSSNIQVIGDVAVQQIVNIQQSFVVNSDLDPGVYPVNLTFTYSDDDGNDFTDEQIITLLVYLVPSIQVSFYEDPGTFPLGQEGTLPIQVVNMDSSDILLGNITVEAANATLSNYTTFVGTLESGGSFTMDTDITPNQSGEIPVNVTIEYQDNFKKSRQVTKTLTITVENQNTGVPGQGLQTTGTPQPSGATGAGQSNENFWQILLRFIRGMIGFDSSSTSRNRVGPGMN